MWLASPFAMVAKRQRRRYSQGQQQQRYQPPEKPAECDQYRLEYLRVHVPSCHL
jgi:hypothetical protein